MADPENIRNKQIHANDTRIACKYGAKCYQKNSAHLQKYKHPPKRETENIGNTAKKIKLNVIHKKEGENSLKMNNNDPKMDIDEQQTDKDFKNIKLNIFHKIQDNKVETLESPQNHQQNTEDCVDLEKKKQDYQSKNTATLNLGKTPKDMDLKEFIKKKFLVQMPSDFYEFWDLCKELKPSCPEKALENIGLSLVGPYDVLAGKFSDIQEQPDENYLIHWRYFFDPPEFQTVLKGNDSTGFHIGYFRDSPDDFPVFLASNSSETDGIFKVKGDNIFSAVSLYMDDLKRSSDPFKKMQIGKLQNIVKKKADDLKLDLSEISRKIKSRDNKITTRSFSKMGIVIPYNKKTQTGYRDLSISNTKFRKLLTDIQNASPERRQVFLSDLQSVVTNASIATDECDFGTGIELGLDILAHGVESLNETILRSLAPNYRFLCREGFARIVEAHMKNRKKGTNLSII